MSADSEVSRLKQEKLKQSHCNAHDSEILDSRSDFKQIKVRTQMQIHLMQTNTNTYLDTNIDTFTHQEAKLFQSAKYQSYELFCSPLLQTVPYLASAFCYGQIQYYHFHK